MARDVTDEDGLGDVARELVEIDHCPSISLPVALRPGDDDRNGDVLARHETVVVISARRGSFERRARRLSGSACGAVSV